MKTAIIYYSKHGTTERVAHLIGEKLSPELEYISLKEFHNPVFKVMIELFLELLFTLGTHED